VKVQFSLAAMLLLAGCVASNAPSPGTAAAVPVPKGMAALTGVMGQSAAGLMSQFGQPILDVREGNARKLQFGSPICVLDAYLYPPQSGRGEPTVTYADTRQRDGSPIDQSSCAAAIRAAQTRR